MRVLTQGELMRMTRIELAALLRRISCELPDLREGSAELRDAHANPQRAGATVGTGAEAVNAAKLWRTRRFT